MCEELKVLLIFAGIAALVIMFGIGKYQETQQMLIKEGYSQCQNFIGSTGVHWAKECNPPGRSD